MKNEMEEYQAFYMLLYVGFTCKCSQRISVLFASKQINIASYLFIYILRIKYRGAPWGGGGDQHPVARIGEHVPALQIKVRLREAVLQKRNCNFLP
jgi:hypothetical protein